MAKLRPVFRPDVGTVTGGNSSFFTDGASACLIGEENYVKAKDLPCRAYLREWVFVAQDPKDELLLGPAYAIPKGFRGDNFISGNHWIIDVVTNAYDKRSNGALIDYTVSVWWTARPSAA